MDGWMDGWMDTWMAGWMEWWIISMNMKTCAHRCWWTIDECMDAWMLICMEDWEFGKATNLKVWSISSNIPVHGIDHVVPKFSTTYSKVNACIITWQFCQDTSYWLYGIPRGVWMGQARQNTKPLLVDYLIYVNYLTHSVSVVKCVAKWHHAFVGFSILGNKTCMSI